MRIFVFFLEKLEKKYGVRGICVGGPYGYGNKTIKIAAEKLHEIGGKFDLIYLIRSLHHLDVMNFSRSSYLSLKNNGKLIIVDWKKGVKTGVQENYFSLDENISFFKYFNLLDKGKGKWNFYLVAEKI